MAQRFIKGALQRRLYGSAASAQKAPAKPVTAGEILVDKASNGVALAAQEGTNSLARVVCAVRAGSRYEDSSERGAAHCLRALSDLTQREVRSFALTRSLQQMGANIAVTSSREHLIYTLEVAQSCVKDALPMLTGMVSQQSFRPWELGDSLHRMEYELTSLAEQPDKRVIESLHYAAFREGGLGRSLYAPMFQLTEFSPDLLRGFVNRNITPDRVSVSAVGVQMDDLKAAVAKMSLQDGGAKDAASPYMGGEIREASEDLLAYTVLTGEGASASGDDLWAFAVLEQLLGAGPQIRWASNVTNNRLNAQLTKKTQDPFHAQSFNVNYSDCGLFGVSAVTVPENSELVIKTVMEQLNELASKPLDAPALQSAKNRVKSVVAFQAECAGDSAENRAVDLLISGKVKSLSDMTTSIDTVNAESIQKAAQKVLNGKLTMSSVGEIHNVPYVDQLK